MSSTNRGGERAPQDVYRTPRHAIWPLLKALRLPAGHWLDLGAGEGNLIRHVDEWRYEKAPMPKWTAVEIRPRCAKELGALGAEVIVGDLRAAEAVLLGRPRFAVAIMNPPFTEALEFILFAQTLARYVVCLERSTFLGDHARRRAAFRNNMPWREYRVGRIDFDGRGGDSTTYSWFVWDQDLRLAHTELRLLEPTHAALRERPRRK